MELVTDFNYELTTPVEYAFKGNMEAGTFIQLNAPTSKVITQCAKLKQAFFRALPKNQAPVEADGPKDGDVTGEEIMTIITMSPDVELSDVLFAARDLFTSGLALVEGEVKLTRPLMDAVSQDDLEGMTGEYLANFILASALRKMKQN